MNGNAYDVVIGLEVHIQLNTRTKLFCADAVVVDDEPNRHAGPITLGLPGTLPRVNRAAVNHAITLGLALNCHIDNTLLFARKHYFYPDLSKGYQTSQHTRPLCSGGELTIPTTGGEKTIRLTRIHLEEDAGKSLHDVLPGLTAIDYNRAGTALCELVTEPCIHSSEEAAAFLTELRRIVRWTGAGTGNMEEGSLRCDANVSLKPAGSPKLGTRVEIKNLNSIRFVKQAIEIEVERMAKLLNEGKPIIQETRSFDAQWGTTFSLRTKEDAEDYRYLSCADLAPVPITESRVQQLKEKLPVLPQALEKQWINTYGFSANEAAQLAADKATADYFAALVTALETRKINGEQPVSRAAANWLLGPVKSYLNENQLGMEAFPLVPSKLAEPITLVMNGTVSFSVASGRLLKAQIKHPEKMAEELVVELGLASNSDAGQLEIWVNQVLQKYPDKVAAYRKGKKGLTGFFTGEVMKLSRGSAHPATLQQLLEKKLNQPSA